MESTSNALLLLGDKVRGKLAWRNVRIVAESADIEVGGRRVEEPRLQGIDNLIAPAAADFGGIRKRSHEHGIKIIIRNENLAVHGVGIIADLGEDIGLSFSGGRLTGLGSRSSSRLGGSLMLLRCRGVDSRVGTKKVLDLGGKGREGPAI